MANANRKGKRDRMDTEASSDALHSAINRGFCSTAKFQQMPDGFPFHVAVSALALPGGSAPVENATGRRIAVGKGEDRDEAAFLALMEAAERYSIQFGNDLSARYTAFRSFGAHPVDESVENLTLGAPTTNGKIRSVGTAAGQYLEDAAWRAVLELLEHHHIDTEPPSSPGWQRISASEVAGLEALAGWLEGQLRVLDCRYLWCEPGYAVVACACTDFDGGRRILGYSAKTSTSAALHNAALEAVFHWRNMVALEFHGRPASAFSGTDLKLFETYRGGTTSKTWPTIEAVSFKETEPSEISLEDLAHAYIAATGQALHLFDFTHPKIGIPVVRAVPGELADRT